MYTYILSALKSNKYVWAGVACIFFVSSVYIAFSNVKASSYQNGYNKAVEEYQIALDQQQSDYQKYIITRLEEVKAKAEEDKEATIQRIKEEQSINDKVDTAIKYVEKESNVQDNCAVIPTNLNSLYNEAIRSINRTRED